MYVKCVYVRLLRLDLGSNNAFKISRVELNCNDLLIYYTALFVLKNNRASLEEGTKLHLVRNQFLVKKNAQNASQMKKKKRTV